MKIIVTGGIGYIGSHIVIDLVDCGHEVIIIDSLSKSAVKIIDRICEIVKYPDQIRFHNISLICYKTLHAFFYETQHVDMCIHLACSHTFQQRSDIYNNNVIGSINLLRCLERYGYEKLLFVNYNHPNVAYCHSIDIIATILQDIDKDKHTCLSVSMPHGSHESALLQTQSQTKESIDIQNIVDVIRTYV